MCLNVEITRLFPHLLKALQTVNLACVQQEVKTLNPLLTDVSHELGFERWHTNYKKGYNESLCCAGSKRCFLQTSVQSYCILESEESQHDDRKNAGLRHFQGKISRIHVPFTDDDKIISPPMKMFFFFIVLSFSQVLLTVARNF